MPHLKKCNGKEDGDLEYTRKFPIERLYLDWLEGGTPTIYKFEPARRLLKVNHHGRFLKSHDGF